MSFLAYYLHWSHAELVGLPHRERREWVRQVSAINQHVNEQEREGF
jgi:hypothetical protein